MFLGIYSTNITVTAVVDHGNGHLFDILSSDDCKIVSEMAYSQKKPTM